jgi:glycosyltransferase involved in cell wall biosynthesis
MIYERFSLFSDAGLRLQRSRQIPRILEINAPLLRERQSVRNPRRAAGIQSEVMQGATRVLVVSRWLKRWAVDEIGCAPQGVRHIPNGVRSPSSGEATDLKESFGNPEILLGFLGSMREWHGLGALPDLLEALPEAAAVLIGDGPVTISHPRLHSLGFIDPDELSATLRALDVGIAPYSRTAPPWLCPLKLLEYRAHGLPIVTTDVADAKLIISENDLAMTTLDPSAWAAAIRAQARRAPEPKLRLWSEVCAEAIEGILLNLRPPPSQG